MTSFVISALASLVVYGAITLLLLVVAGQSAGMGSSLGGIKFLAWLITIVGLVLAAVFGGQACFFGCLTGVAAVTLLFRGGLLFK